MPTLFDDFLNTDFMPRANSTAPAVNVKENEKDYTMELAAPGIKKEYCRVGINEEGNLTIAIENTAFLPLQCRRWQRIRRNARRPLRSANK